MKTSKLNPLLAAIVAVSSASASAALIEVQFTGTAKNQTTDIQGLPAPNPPDIANSGISYSSPRIGEDVDGSLQPGDVGYGEGWPARLTLWIDDQTGEIVNFESGLTANMYFSSQGLQHDLRAAGRTYNPGGAFTCHQFDGADDGNGFLGCNGQVGRPNNMQLDANGAPLPHLDAQGNVDPNSIILANGRTNQDGTPATNAGDGTVTAWATLSAPGYECGTFDPTASSTNGCARGWGLGQRVAVVGAPEVYIPQDARYGDNGSAAAFPSLVWANDGSGNYSAPQGVCLDLTPSFTPVQSDGNGNCGTMPFPDGSGGFIQVPAETGPTGQGNFCLDPAQGYQGVLLGTPGPVFSVQAFDMIDVPAANGDIDQYPLHDQNAPAHPFNAIMDPLYETVQPGDDVTVAFLTTGPVIPITNQATCEGFNFYNFVLGMGRFNAWAPQGNYPGIAYGQRFGTNFPVMKSNDATQKANAKVYHETQGQRAGGYFSVEHTGTLAGGDFQVTGAVYQHDTDIAFPTSDGTAYAQSFTRFEFDNVTYQGPVIENNNVPAMGAWSLAGLFAGLVAVAARLRRRVS